MSTDAGREVASEEAGRELDALVAEKVFGWTVKWMPTALSPGQPHYLNSEEGSGWLFLRFYSNDMGAAWSVVEAMRDKGWRVRVEVRRSGAYCDLIASDGADSARADTAPLAICLAALNAIESRESSLPTTRTASPDLPVFSGRTEEGGQ